MKSTLSPFQRHLVMSSVHSKDTKPEMVVRRYLWRCGFRYRLSHKRLPGKPDVVLTKYRTCIFVNGCFWHGHDVALPQIENEKLKIENSACCRIPMTNREFWVNKITRNKERDLEVQRKLAQMGWHTITVWECQLKPKHREETLRSLVYTLNHIFLSDRIIRPYKEQEPLPMMAAEE